MQKFMLRLAGFALVLSAMVFVSCEEDDPGPGPTPLGPEINLSGDAGFLSTDTQLEPGVAFSVRLNVIQGDNELSSITIFKGSAQLPTSEFTVTSLDQGAITSNNPFLITGTDTDGGTFDITIQPTDMDGEFSTYSFEVRDSGGETDETSIAITTVRSATPLTGEFTTVVVNNADGPDEGGLDLDTGMSVPRDSDMAELRDRGIDTNLPLADNWRQTVEPRNGAELRIPATTGEPLVYANVDSREAIIAEWDRGTDATESGVLEQGDLLLVRSGDDYYLIEVGTVTVTASDNTDFYEFNIKQSTL